MNSLPSGQSLARRWLATAAVAAVMLGILGAGWALARTPTPPGSVDIGQGVVVSPPEGWRVDPRSIGSGTVLLSRGDASLAISVASGVDEMAAVAGQRDQWLAGGRVTVGEIVPISLRQGQPALRFAYSGTFQNINSPVEGTFTGVRGTASVVLFDGWAGFGGYAPVATDIDDIIRASGIP